MKSNKPARQTVLEDECGPIGDTLRPCNLHVSTRFATMIFAFAVVFSLACAGVRCSSQTVITIDANAAQHPISPLIYGVAFATGAQLTDLNAPLNRSGGNGTTRYNWKLNASNHANDWYFESIASASSIAGGDGDSFFSSTTGAGALPMLTIPTIGWVANLGTNRASLDSFSVAKYGPQQSMDPYWSDAGNGVNTSGINITGNNPLDANITADSVFQQGWVQHLITTWGNSASGGLKYYILDNEPSIWHSTHRDVHPVGAKMSEILNDIITYGGMIKSQDPNAVNVGPEEWGWTGYLWSGYDQWYAGIHGWGGSLPDQTANGGAYYLPWLLTQLHQDEVNTGKRKLDVFSVHFYPQDGSDSNAVDTNTQLLRNKSTRSLWDPSYVDQSWIGTNIELIPRLKGWVSSYYPGLKVAITEYNWGAEANINGATTQADIYGIFGQQGLDMATRWTVPDPSTPTYLAMKMYRNYDGHNAGFGDTSVSATVPNPDNLSSFAALRSSDGALTIMVINKVLPASPPANTNISLNVANFAAMSTAHAYQLMATNVITQLADVAVSNGMINASVPAQSITLFVLPAALTIPTAVTFNPASVTGGLSSTGTVTLRSAAPAGGVTISLSSTAGASVPSSIAVAAGKSSATFTATTSPVASSITATIKAAANGASASGTLKVNGYVPTSVSLNPTIVTGGASSTGTVTINGAALTGGLAVTLSSTSGATVPATVTVPTGKSSATFKITTVAVSSNTTATITASANGTPKSASLTVNGPLPSAVTISPAAIAPGGTTAGKLTMSSAAPIGGMTVALSSSGPVKAPASVTIASGSTTVAFTVTGVAVSTNTSATITASANGKSVSATVTVTAPTPTGVTLSPASVTGGGTSTGTVTINGPAPTAGLSVTLVGTGSASVPASVKVAAGTKSAAFTIKTSAVAAKSTSSISGTCNSVTKSTTLTIIPPALLSLAFSPTSVVGGRASSLTISLTGPAPTGGVIVTLSSNRPTSITLPVSAPIPAGSSSVTISVATVAVKVNTGVTVTGHFNVVSRAAALTLTP